MSIDEILDEIDLYACIISDRITERKKALTNELRNRLKYLWVR